MNPLDTRNIGLSPLVPPLVAALLLTAPLARAEAPEPGDEEESETSATAAGDDESQPEEEASAEEEAAEDEGTDEPAKAGKAGKKAEESQAKVLLPASEKGATVMLDGEDVGVTPLAPLTGLTVGKHDLRVDKEGFYTYTAEIDVPQEGDLRHDILLDGGASKKTELPAFMKTWWFWTAVGAVVLTGATVGIYYGVKEDPPDAVKFPPY